MISRSSRDRLFLLAVGLVVLFGPVVILVLTIGTLVILGDLTFDQVTPVEFLELYVVDLVVFVGLAYGVYRLTLWSVELEGPSSPDTVEDDETPEGTDEVSDHSGER